MMYSSDPSSICICDCVSVFVIQRPRGMCKMHSESWLIHGGPKEVIFDHSGKVNLLLSNNRLLIKQITRPNGINLKLTKESDLCRVELICSMENLSPKEPQRWINCRASQSHLLAKL